MKKYKSIDEYISSQPKEIQIKLESIRKTILNCSKDLEQTISYGMPTLKLNGKNLVHFACFKKHIGFYPTPSPIEKFENKLKKYKYSKGAIQFPINESLPLSLIKEITIERIKELNNGK